MVTRSRVDEIRIVGRNTQGVRIMNLKEGDRIANVAKIAAEAKVDESHPDVVLTNELTQSEPTIEPSESPETGDSQE